MKTLLLGFVVASLGLAGLAHAAPKPGKAGLVIRVPEPVGAKGKVTPPGKVKPTPPPRARAR